jgi:hypothetical protein
MRVDYLKDSNELAIVGEDQAEQDFLKLLYDASQNKSWLTISIQLSKREGPGMKIYGTHISVSPPKDSE